MFGENVSYDHVDPEFATPAEERNNTDTTTTSSVYSVESGNMVVDNGDDENISFCQRVRWELGPRSPWFVLEEPGRTQLDVERSFAVRNFPLLLWRIFCLSWSASALAAHVVAHRRYFAVESLFFDDLAHWSWVAVLCYQLSVVLLSSVRGRVLRQPLEGDPPSFLVRFALLSYCVAAPTQTILLLVFVVAGYDPPPALDDLYTNTTRYVVLTIAVLFDGNVPSIVPLKLKHALATQIFLATYVARTVLHDVFEIPNVVVGGDGDGDRRRIYPFLHWREEFWFTLLFYVVGVVVVCPLVFFVLWAVSMTHTSGLTGRRRPRYGGQYLPELPS